MPYWNDQHRRLLPAQTLSNAREQKKCLTKQPKDRLHFLEKKKEEIKERKQERAGHLIDLI